MQKSPLSGPNALWSTIWETPRVTFVYNFILTPAQAAIQNDYFISHSLEKYEHRQKSRFLSAVCRPVIKRRLTSQNKRTRGTMEELFLYVWAMSENQTSLKKAHFI
jgi:hypothetical protein